MDNRYLDWSIDADDNTFAGTSRGEYCTEEMHDETYGAWWQPKGGARQFLGYSGTRDEAETACQHHYESSRAEAQI